MCRYNGFFFLKNPMFPLHQSSELVFQISNDAHKRNKISQDLILGHHPNSMDVTFLHNIINKGHRDRRRLIAAAPNLEDTTPLNSNNSSSNNKDKKKKKKKMMTAAHRDIERLRRQEMSTLYASLRALLPPHLIKGKRSISDHIIEAVNYIKLLENNIKKLSLEKDELKKLSKYSDNSSEHHESGSPSAVESRLTVRPFSDGVEVIISSRSRRSSPLSRVLEVLLQQGLTVAHCASTTVDDKFHHIIHSDQVDNLETINLPSLEKKLREAISS